MGSIVGPANQIRELERQDRAQREERRAERKARFSNREVWKDLAMAVGMGALAIRSFSESDSVTAGTLGTVSTLYFNEARHDFFQPVDTPTTGQTE